MTTMPIFKERLQELMRSKNISQSDIVRGTSFDKAQVSNWLSETVKNPRDTTIHKLAYFFECNIEWLASGKGEPYPQSPGPKTPPLSPVVPKTTFSDLLYQEWVKQDANQRLMIALPATGFTANTSDKELKAIHKEVIKTISDKLEADSGRQEFLDYLENPDNQEKLNSLTIEVIQEMEKGANAGLTTKIELHKIPVLGNVPAGIPNTLEEYIEEYISVPNAPPDCYALKVDGESMEPGIRHGDYVLFVIDRDPQSGDVVVVNDEFGDSMIKRYKVKDDDVRLVSDNPAYPTYIPNDHYRIMGVVVGGWRELKI